MKFLDAAFEKFCSKKPVSVMMRATLENVLSASRLNRLFDDHAQEQYTGELLFSTVADLMGEVVLNIQPSINSAWRERQEEIGVTVKSVYDKLKGIEPEVSRALVRDTAARMASIIQQMEDRPEPLVAGYRTKIVDGNHLRRTDRRIKELRERNVAPLPGKSLVVLDPQLRLAVDVLPCEDGHAQERSLLVELLEIVERKDLWVGDRNFCTVDFLFGIARRNAKFVIRQHGNLPYELKERRRLIGETETGTVYEQAMSVTHSDGQTLVFRRIEIQLHESTRDGEDVVFLVTNLPQRVSALKIADLYRNRWTIETAFQEMAENLEGEIQTLGYPKAALFGFCMALVSFNLMSVVRAAVGSRHGEEAAQTFSMYYACNEVSQTSEGMSVVLPGSYWQNRYGSLTPSQMANELHRLAGNIDLRKYKKNRWTKKNKPPAKSKKGRRHASTFKILKEARNKQTQVQK
jgi:Transposase DDE domain